jgi:hypothetical protein
MHELDMEYGYYVFWIICVCFTVFSLIWFWKKKWIDFRWIVGSTRKLMGQRKSDPSKRKRE